MGCAGSIWAQEAHAPLDYTDVLANGLALHVAVVGEGELVVVVPGGPGLEHTYLLPHFMRLASSHRCCCSTHGPLAARRAMFPPTREP